MYEEWACLVRNNLEKVSVHAAVDSVMSFVILFLSKQDIFQTHEQYEHALRVLSLVTFFASIFYFIRAMQYDDELARLEDEKNRNK